jgi:predicted phage terminase large subunit-like protein
MIELDERQLIELAERDLYTFVAMAWRYAGGKKEFIPNWYIEAICEHLEALYYLEIKNLIISIAPRKGKSLICSVIYPAWVWLRDIEHRFITASYGAELAVRDSKRTKDLIESTWFQRKWGERVKLKVDQRAKGKYETVGGGRRIATSVDGMATGEGADTLIIDDPHKAKEATSIAKLRNVIEWFTGTMSNRYEDIDTFRKLIIHQRVSNGDLTGYLLSEEKGEWEHLLLPEEYIPNNKVTGIGWMDPRKYKGELLAPELFGEEDAEKFKKNRFFWASQYQQDPVPEEGGYILTNQIYRFSPQQLYSTTRKVDGVYTTWDLAKGQDILNDYTVGQLWIVIGRKKFLVGKRKGKWNYGQQLKNFRELNDVAKSWEVKSLQGTVHLVELMGNGDAFKDTLNTQFNIGGIIGINPRKDKINRFMEVTYEFEEGNIYVMEGVEGDEFKTELTGFPFSKNDDEVDACSQFLEKVRDIGCRILEFPKIEERKSAMGVRDIVAGFKESEGYNIRVSGVKRLFDN